MSHNVAIDARWLAGGIGTYTKNLLAGVAKQRNGFKFRAITSQENASLVGQWCDQVTVVDTPIYTFREQFTVPRAANGCDLLHVPHYNAPLLHRGPLLVSILDLIHITDPTYSRSINSWVYARPILALAARKADHIVTISEYSKTQIVERLRVSPSKLTVIHCGVDSQFHFTDRREAFREVSSALQIKQPYLLYVGSLKPHKNVVTLLRAFALLTKLKDVSRRLVIIGDDARWKRPLLEMCAHLGINDATSFVPHVAQELLPKVYAGADLLVMPSTLEGFGLPVLEAMACGTPVACSRAASLPEVGGEAVLYFDPTSPEELASVIERVLSSRELQERLCAKGLERAKEFTWKESTRKHIEVYQHLLGLN